MHSTAREPGMGGGGQLAPTYSDFSHTKSGDRIAHSSLEGMSSGRPTTVRQSSAGGHDPVPGISYNRQTTASSSSRTTAPDSSAFR